MNVCSTPTQYEEVCINTTTGSVSRLENCTSSGLAEFNPVMDRTNPCGIGYGRPTRARCRVYHPQGDDAAATGAAVSGVNAISCRQCRLIVTVTRPGVVDPITEFVITDLQHFTFADGTDYINSFIYFDPLALAGNANDGDNTAVDAWTNNLNGFLLQGDVFNLCIDPGGGVTTDDALALTFIHGKDTRTPENGGISWERNRAGISPRDYTVWVSFTTEVDGVAQTISMTSLQAHKIVFVNHFFSSSTLTFQYAIDGEPYWY